MKKNPLDGMTEQEKFYWQQNEQLKMKAIGFLVMAFLTIAFVIYVLIKM